MEMIANLIKYKRQNAEKLPVSERIKHYGELFIAQSEETIMQQASRCLDCGMAYCNYACPLGNVLPDLNALVADGHWKKALHMLHESNNFPEFTGRLCPALCEASCTLSINDEATTTREIELSIIEKAYAEGWVKAQLALINTGKEVAVIGSGPSGLAVAQQLIRKGHRVTVFEREDTLGGVLARGIPDYKLDKSVIMRRLEQLRQEGVVFNTGIHVGQDTMLAFLEDYDAICLCGGSTVPRDLSIEGRALKGIHFAMDFLKQQNEINNGTYDGLERISAENKNVVVIGGGDTGADCLGVAIRQGAKEVYQLELMPKPPEDRTLSMPWPYWPMILRSNSAHEEGGIREWSILTKYFSGEDYIEKVHCVKVEWHEEDGKKKMVELANSDFIIEADLVLFAMGFLHPEHDGIIKKIGLEVDQRGNAKTKDYQTNISKIFAAGDFRTGQSLVCKAIADGRKAAEAIHKYLIE